MKTNYFFKILLLSSMFALVLAGCNKNKDEDPLLGGNEKNHIDKYVNGDYVGQTWNFEDLPWGVACTSDGKTIWVITQNKYTTNKGGELKQGDENGNFNTIDTFDDEPNRVALSADGSLGYVVTNGNNVCKYVNGSYIGHIWNAGLELDDVACTDDGKVIWVLKENTLQQGDENGNFHQIDTFSDPAVGVTLSADGSIGYVITQDG